LLNPVPQEYAGTPCNFCLPYEPVYHVVCWYNVFITFRNI